MGKVIFYTLVFATWVTNALASQSAQELALKWMRCPPQNPYNKYSPPTYDPIKAPNARRCDSPSDWDLSCIGFAFQIASNVESPNDPRLISLKAGFPASGQITGDALGAFNALVAKGLAHTYVPGEDLTKIPAGAAVFFLLDGTTYNHVAIASGYITNETGTPEPLIISTGFNSDGHSGIHFLPLSKLGGDKQQWWHLKGWADL